MPKRVAIDYEDGHYGLYEPRGRWAPNLTEQDKADWLLRNTIEITDEEWQSYQRFQQDYRFWQTRIQHLDEEAYQNSKESCG